MSLRSLFTEHPASVGETYLQHLHQAARFGVRLLLAGVACVVHALLPFLFTRIARDAVEALHAQLSKRNASQSTVVRRRA